MDTPKGKNEYAFSVSIKVGQDMITVRAESYNEALASLKAFKQAFEETFPPRTPPQREPITDMGGSDDYENRKYQKQQSKYWPCPQHGTQYEAHGKKPPHRPYCAECLRQKNTR